MAETTTITIRVPVETKTKLDRLAELTKRSRSYLAAEALEIYLRNELEIVKSILEGLADVEAGRFYTHEQVSDEMRAIVAKAKRKAKRTAA
ncbi:MAG: ribbon-helix-helix protein, CopG family [Devosia sp.]|nr:ribbon-helix-helix protein, CopG family [Devosia sp.]